MHAAESPLSLAGSLQLDNGNLCRLGQRQRIRVPAAEQPLSSAAAGSSSTLRHPPCLAARMSEGPPSPALAPAAAPLPEVDDIHREILLRLPPLPSSLPRASLVCKRWRRIVSDPRFLRRFRARHRTPPILGFFVEYPTEPIFVPTLGRPNCIPRKRFSFPPFPFNGWSFHGCRHGLALLFDLGLLEAIVWDPVTGSQHRVPFPPELNVGKGYMCSGAVLSAAGDHGNGNVHDIL
ncbi:hypothetical protein ACP70R_028272 [Stipagrostis hirtigluma subsp. patula]